MDTLAIGVIAVGVVAAIGVVLVAMGGSGSEAVQAAPAEPPKSPPAPHPRPSPRPKQQAVPIHAAPAPYTNGYMTAGQDPLVDAFMQVMSGEMQALRVQQEKIDRRLELINGIAELMRDMQRPAANGLSDLSTSSNKRIASQG